MGVSRLALPWDSQPPPYAPHRGACWVPRRCRLGTASLHGLTLQRRWCRGEPCGTTQIHDSKRWGEQKGAQSQPGAGQEEEEE